MKYLMPLLAVFLWFGTVQSATVLDFEGLQDQEQILEYYNGGTGSFGSGPGTDYDISFGSNALAIIDADAGGTGNFGGEPSPDTVMYFLEGSAVLNSPAGFNTGFSFSYSAVNTPGSIVVYDGLNATGNVLSNISLPVTPSDGGDPNGAFSPFINVGVPISGTARSIDFGGTVNQIGFDNITFGSATPGVEADMPFLVGDQLTNPGLSSRTTTYFVDNTTGEREQDKFDPNAPTYIVTHGWQNDKDYLDALTWDGFENQDMPVSQENIILAIGDRLFAENASLKANIIAFEWEGAYTGGMSTGSIPVDDELLIVGSRQARNNADSAGVLLGNALSTILGDDYEQDLHFIGHSYGTVVNGLATRYLEDIGFMENYGTVQFTTLDAPTDAPIVLGVNFAPGLDSDWFINNLSNNVDYLDNYYGLNSILTPDVVEAYGEPLDGSGLDQAVDYWHTNVAKKFYPDLILHGDDADTNPIGLDIWPYNHEFDDWITPLLTTYDDRPGDDFSNAGGSQWAVPVSAEYENAIGTAIEVASLPGYDTYTFNGFLLEEASPVSLKFFLETPLEAEWLAFDWMVENGGDGDWITAHFGSDLLWSMVISDFLEGTLLTALIDISDYAGMANGFFLTLNSVGDANASFYAGNFEYLGNNSTAPVPEPSTILLMGLGLVGLAGYGRKRIKQ